jgi:hypothetical protein
MANGTNYSGASYTCNDLSGSKSSRYRLQEITYGGMGSTFDVAVNSNTFSIPAFVTTGEIPRVFYHNQSTIRIPAYHPWYAGDLIACA